MPNISILIALMLFLVWTEGEGQHGAGQHACACTSVPFCSQNYSRTRTSRFLV